MPRRSCTRLSGAAAPVAARMRRARRPGAHPRGDDHARPVRLGGRRPRGAPRHSRRPLPHRRVRGDPRTLGRRDPRRRRPRRERDDGRRGRGVLRPQRPRRPAPHRRRVDCRCGRGDDSRPPLPMGRDRRRLPPRRMGSRQGTVRRRGRRARHRRLPSGGRFRTRTPRSGRQRGRMGRGRVGRRQLGRDLGRPGSGGQGGKLGERFSRPICAYGAASSCRAALATRVWVCGACIPLERPGLRYPPRSP